jgi:hypothetical protein
MAVSTPLGEMRFNPNTFMQEMWDGKSWVEVDSVSTINYPNSYGPGATVGGVTMISAAGTVTTPLTANQREDIFEFLKDNLRVAEYTDEKGKTLYVELQMRAGDGYAWDKIRRVKLKETDDML